VTSKVTMCLINLEMLGSLTAVSECQEIGNKEGEMSERCRQKILSGKCVHW